MKEYIVTLELIVSAKNEADAKKEFWAIVDDGDFNTEGLEVEEN